MPKPRGDTLWSKCADAIDVLNQRPEPFNEFDVAVLASRDQNWDGARRIEAVREANRVLNVQFRHGRLARFGPVVFSDETADYVRRAGKIMHVGLDERRPLLASVTTPNGVFPAVTSWDTPPSLRHVGRKRTISNDRDDWVAWDQQGDAVRYIAR